MEEEYRALGFPGLSSSSKALDSWGIEGHSGGLRAAGIGTGITGRGAHLIIIDDPVKDQEEAHSPAVLENQWEWYQSTARTRLEPGGAIVLIQTRWCKGDLYGRLEEASNNYVEDSSGEKWKEIVLPAETDGLPLWPERFPIEALNEIRSAVGPTIWAALYQQNPSWGGAGLVSEEDIPIVDKIYEPVSQWVRFWDMAGTTSSKSDFTSGALVGLGDSGTRYIVNITRGRWEYPDAKSIIIQTGSTDPKGCWVGIENTSSGIPLIQDLRRDKEGARLRLFPVNVSINKKIRASPWAASAKSGLIKLVRGSWNLDFIEEAISFPHGKHDDQVDSISGAMELIVQGGMVKVFGVEFGSNPNSPYATPVSPEEAAIIETRVWERLEPSLQQHVLKILAHNQEMKH